MRFGKDRRLRKRADFLRVQSEGRRVTTPHFTLLVAARGDDGAPACARLGIVVTKKIGGAVQRNRIKRVCRECFRLWPEMLPDGADLVVIARAGAHELTRDDVAAEWRAAHRPLLKRAAEALAQGASRPHVSGARRSSN